MQGELWPECSPGSACVGRREAWFRWGTPRPRKEGLSSKLESGLTDADVTAHCGPKPGIVGPFRLPFLVGLKPLVAALMYSETTGMHKADLS